MQTQLLKEIRIVLQGFSEYWENDVLKRYAVITAIENKDNSLIKALIANEKIKQEYSTDIGGVTLFDFAKLVNLIQYKEYWQDSYTKYKNKIGLTASNGSYLDYNADVVLDFPFKDCVLEGGMTKEDVGKDEVYYNEVIAADEIDRLFQPKVLTNAKRYSVGSLEENITKVEDTDNLIIKGNNLLALHSLKERFFGKVKLIYIDPPFNTGNDEFEYNDRFTHSTWLAFMKNRLEIAKSLLRNDGVILVHCDYNEDAYLRVLMDEIFTRDKLVAQITVKSNSISGTKTQHKDKTVLKNKDTILFYKMSEKITINPQYTIKDKWDTHYNGFLQFDGDEYYITPLKDLLVEKNIISSNERIKPDILENSKFKEFAYKHRDNILQTVGSIPSDLKKLSAENPDKVVWLESQDGEKVFAFNERRLSMLSSVYQNIGGENVLAQLLGDLWTDIDFQNTQNEGGISFPNGKKPEALIQRIINLTTEPKDIVLDYHLGSGTTAAVAHKMGRQYIGIEQMDYIEKLSVERLKNVIDGDSSGISSSVNWKGGGSFVYFELAKLNQNYIEKITEAEIPQDLLHILDTMKAEAYLNYQIELENVLNTNYELDGINHMVSFSDLPLSKQKAMLIGLLDKNQLYINLSEIDDIDMQVSGVDKQFSNSFYEKGV